MKPKAEYVGDWLRKAASDLKIARREMQAPDPASDAVCFHFQQAVEKTLKAWLAWCEKPFPLTHNIEVLLAACETLDDQFEQLRDAETLTPYAVEVRHADDIYFPTTEEMAEAAELAAQVERFVKDRLESRGFVAPH